MTIKSELGNLFEQYSKKNIEALPDNKEIASDLLKYSIESKTVECKNVDEIIQNVDYIIKRLSLVSKKKKTMIKQLTYSLQEFFTREDKKYLKKIASKISDKYHSLVNRKEVIIRFFGTKKLF